VARQLFSKQSNYPNAEKRGPKKRDMKNDFLKIDFKYLKYHLDVSFIQ
jgi:hypothetical protein